MSVGSRFSPSPSPSTTASAGGGAGGATTTTTENVLSDLISSRSWPAVLARLDSHPAEASMPSSSYYRDYHFGERSLLRTAATAASLPGGRRHRHAMGLVAGGAAVAEEGSRGGGGGGGMDLPLHELCRIRYPPAPVHVVEALIASYPDGTATADRRGRLPLHLALLSFPPPLGVGGGGTCAAGVGGEGRLEMRRLSSLSASSAARAGAMGARRAQFMSYSPTAPIDTVRALVEAYPRAVRVAVGGRCAMVGSMMAAAAATSQAEGGGGTRTDEGGESSSASSGVGGGSGSGSGSSGSGSGIGGNTLPLHLAVKHGADADVVEYLLARHPLAHRERDEYGRTPVDYLSGCDVNVVDDEDEDDDSSSGGSGKASAAGGSSGDKGETEAGGLARIGEDSFGSTEIWKGGRRSGRGFGAGKLRDRRASDVRAVLDRAPAFVLAAESAVEAAKAGFAYQLRTNIETHIAQVTKLQIGRKQTEERLRSELDVALKNVHYLSEELSIVRSKTERESDDARAATALAKRELDDERDRNARLLRAMREVEWNAAEQRGRSALAEERLRHALTETQRHAADVLSRAERLSVELDQTRLNENAIAARAANLERQLELASGRIFDLEEIERDLSQTNLERLGVINDLTERLRESEEKLESQQKEIDSLKAEVAKDESMKEEDRIRLKAFEWAAEEDAQSRMAERVKRLQGLVRTARGGGSNWARDIGEAMSCVKGLPDDISIATYDAASAASSSTAVAPHTPTPSVASSVAFAAAVPVPMIVPSSAIAKSAMARISHAGFSPTMAAKVAQSSPTIQSKRNYVSGAGGGGGGERGNFPSLLSVFTSSTEAKSIATASKTPREEARSTSPPLSPFPGDRYSIKPAAAALSNEGGGGGEHNRDDHYPVGAKHSSKARDGAVVVGDHPRASSNEVCLKIVSSGDAQIKLKEWPTGTEIIETMHYRRTQTKGDSHVIGDANIGGGTTFSAMFPPRPSPSGQTKPYFGGQSSSSTPPRPSSLSAVAPSLENRTAQLLTPPILGTYKPTLQTIQTQARPPSSGSSASAVLGCSNTPPRIPSSSTLTATSTSLRTPVQQFKKDEYSCSKDQGKSEEKVTKSPDSVIALNTGL